MHNKTRKNCIKLIKTIEKCKKVVYYEAINKEETGRGTTNNKGGGIVDRRDHDRCQELYVKYRQFMYWYVKKHFPDLPEEDIRDILQEVWTSLLNAIDKLYDKGDEGQFAWLIRVTQTKVIDYYRSRKRTEELGEKIGLALREQQEVGSVQDIVIKFDADYDNVTWYGMGPEETYVDRCEGAKLGIYRNKVEDNMAKYMVPQECGNKVGVRWASVTDRKGRGMLFTGDAMEFSALPYTPHEMENAMHPFELPQVHYTVVRVSKQQMGIAGDDSWGAKPLPEYLIKTDEKMEFTFTFKGI